MPADTSLCRYYSALVLAKTGIGGIGREVTERQRLRMFLLVAAGERQLAKIDQKHGVSAEWLANGEWGSNIFDGCINTA